MKRIFSILVACLLTQAAYCKSQIAEFKSGYFFFVDQDLKDVYGTGAADIQLSYSYLFSNYLGVYGSVEYIQQDGNSTPCHDRVEFYSVPLSLGLKATISLHKHVDFFAIIGPRYFFTHVKNYSDLVDRNIYEHGLGGFGALGILWHLFERLTLDVFTEYSYKKFTFHGSKPGVKDRSTQVGGVAIGAGIGYQY